MWVDAGGRGSTRMPIRAPVSWRGYRSDGFSAMATHVVIPRAPGNFKHGRPSRSAVGGRHPECLCAVRAIARCHHAEWQRNKLAFRAAVVVLPSSCWLTQQLDTAIRQSSELYERCQLPAHQHRINTQPWKVGVQAGWRGLSVSLCVPARARARASGMLTPGGGWHLGAAAGSCDTQTSPLCDV
jgi:hypothetical protein